VKNLEKTHINCKDPREPLRKLIVRGADLTAGVLTAQTAARFGPFNRLYNTNCFL
jgi:hypothetical protein